MKQSFEYTESLPEDDAGTCEKIEVTITDDDVKFAFHELAGSRRCLYLTFAQFDRAADIIRRARNAKIFAKGEKPKDQSFIVLNKG